MESEYLKDITYQKIEERVAYQGKRIQVNEVRYDTGKQMIYREHVIAGPAVVILAITENQTVLMVQEQRTAVGKIITSLPAGRVEQGEKQSEGAIRELEEETGYRAHNIKFLRSYCSTCGYSDEKVDIYLATKLEKTKQNLDADEELTVLEVPLQKVKQLIEKNEIIDSSTVIAIMHYMIYEEK